jgi:hypothetical protein
MPWRPGQLIVALLWLAGLPCLTGGMAFDAVALVATGGWSLLAATVLDALQMAIIARHAYRGGAATSRREAGA